MDEIFLKNQQFKQERQAARNEFNSQCAILQAELNAKKMKLQAELDKKLQDIARRQDQAIRDYREWKNNKTNRNETTLFPSLCRGHDDPNGNSSDLQRQ